MARWKLALPAVVVVGMVAGFVTVSFGSSPVHPAGPGEDSYGLSDFRVAYPFVNELSGETREGVAGVTMVAQPTTDRFAGDVDCHLEVFSADGDLVGQNDFALGYDGIEPLEVGPVTVPVSGVAASAQGYCEKGQPPDPNAGYVFSDLRTVQEPHPALVGNISWNEGIQPGEFQCTAVIETSSGRVDVPFTLAQEEGEGKTIVLLSEERAQGEPVAVTCEPMVGQPLST